MNPFQNRMSVPQQRPNQDNRNPNSTIPDFDISKLTGDLLMTIAKECAEKIGNDRDKMTTSQVRRFYMEFKKMERLCERCNMDEFKNKHWPIIGMMKAKVAYQKSRRGMVKISESFKSFIDKGIEKINGDQKKFLNFCKLFEAVLGYLSEYLRA